MKSPTGGTLFLPCPLAAALLVAGCGSTGVEPAGQLAAPVSCPAADAPDEAFGCANAVNLEMMLANPSDLEAPAELGAARGDAAFDAARRHRQGEVRALPGGGDYSAAGGEPEAE